MSLQYNTTTEIFTLIDKAQNKFMFDGTNGRLTTYTTVNGKLLLYTYDAADRLTKISDQDNQRYLTLAYSLTKIAPVTDHTGRSVTYNYDTNNNIVTATDVLGKLWRYEYKNGTNYLERVRDPDLKVIEYTQYDTNSVNHRFD